MYNFRRSTKVKLKRIAILFIEREGKHVEFASAVSESQIAHLRRKEKELKEEGTNCWIENL